MSFYDYATFINTQLASGAIQTIQEQQQRLREDLERYVLGDNWRITTLTMDSETTYEATLPSRMMPNPRYIALAPSMTLRIEARENRPTEGIVNGMRVSFSRKYLRFKAIRAYDGRLWITEPCIDEVLR